MIEAGLAHAPVFAAIHAESFDAEDRWTDADFATQLALPGVFGLIEPPGAFILVRQAADEAEVLTLAVAPAARRQGYARALLVAAHGRLQASGAVTVFLEVAAGNLAARMLYDALGYRAVGVRHAYYGPTDAWIMRRDFRPPEPT